MAARIRTFKDLVVWQKAMELSVQIYHLTKKYPTDEKFGLTVETRKTSRSIPYNIAEGHKRSTTADYIRFLSIAAGSASELETQLLLCRRLKSLGSEEPHSVLADIEELSKMLASLISKLRD